MKGRKDLGNHPLNPCKRKPNLDEEKDRDEGKQPSEDDTIRKKPRFSTEKEDNKSQDAKKPSQRVFTKGIPSWNNYIRSLAVFKARHGHLHVPSKFVDHDAGLDLGSWVGLLQREYAARQKNPLHRSQVLTERRVAVLEAMGLVWGRSQPQQDMVNNRNYQFHHNHRVNSITWNDNFLKRRSAHPASFHKWAKQEIQLLEGCDGESSSSQCQQERSGLPCFLDLEISFRIALLKLSIGSVPDMFKANP